MQHILRGFLQNYKKKTVDLDTLQKLMPGHIEYPLFAELILNLEAEGVLTRIKSAKENNKERSLAYKYSISLQALKQEYLKRLQYIQLDLDQKISLESYFHLLSSELFEKDLKSIYSINAYIKSKGLPKEPITLPKLSYDLVQDEKWLQEKGGIALLKRIKLWTSLQTTLRFEPVVFSLNPNRINERVQYHLIVENKTTFMELMEGLSESSFTSLIYGAGWQIISGIQQFKQQIGTTSVDEFYYFGDLDHEGLHIWYSLNEQVKVTLAIPFYEALLNKKPSMGKENQKRHEASIETFAAHFDENKKATIQTMLTEKGYYPQETLNKNELITTLKAYRINALKIQTVNEDIK